TTQPLVLGDVSNVGETDGQQNREVGVQGDGRPAHVQSAASTSRRLIAIILPSLSRMRTILYARFLGACSPARDAVNDLVEFHGREKPIVTFHTLSRSSNSTSSRPTLVGSSSRKTSRTYSFARRMAS